VDCQNKKYSSNLFSTSSPKQKLTKRNNTVERTLREMAKSRKSLGGSLGQIQVRIAAEGLESVNFEKPALKL
jgi:hypothetical protein